MANYLKSAKINGKEYRFPMFLPDATRAIVRSIDSVDLKNAGIEGVVVNTYHLMTDPGTQVIKSLGGIHKFMNFDGLITSDSGGFQLLSLIYKNKSFGTINDRGVIFHRSSKGKVKKYNFTPEKSIQVQFGLDADLLICLDDCPSVKANDDEIKISVRRTIEWAKRCKEEFEKKLKNIKTKKLKLDKPALLAVIQGGHDKKLREFCAKELIKIGFDAYGFGGWPLNKDGTFNFEIVNFTASLMPNDKPKFALGVGSIEAIIQGTRAGYSIFDCVLPTRDARHERLYVFNEDPEKIDIFNDPNPIGHLYIKRERHVRDGSPISEFCDCHTCQNYSKAYLLHLFEIKESLAWRLATIHNLRTYSKLIEILRRTIS